MSTKPPPTPKPRRRWLQFSLRTTMVLILSVSVSLGWFAHRRKQAKEQEAAVLALRVSGGARPFCAQSASNASG